MTAPTPEERAEWQADCKQGRGHGLREGNRRILALLAALEEAERERDDALEELRPLDEAWQEGYSASERDCPHRERAEVAERAHEAERRACLAVNRERKAAEAERDRLREGLTALADEWESWGRGRSTPRIDAFRDAARSLRALLGDQS